MSQRAEEPGAPGWRGLRIAVLPTTPLGWWAVGLALAFVGLVVLTAVVRAAARSRSRPASRPASPGSQPSSARESGRSRSSRQVVPLLFAAVFVVAELVGG